MAVASLVLGIIAIVLAFIPIINLICPILGILSVVFGIVNLCKDSENARKFSKPVVGILLASLAMIISFFTINFYGLIGLIALNELDSGTSKYNYQYTYKNDNKTNNKINNNYYYKNTIKK